MPSKGWFHGRRLGPLLSAWISAAIVAGLTYWFEYAQPAFHDIVLPIYWTLTVVLIVTTGRWIRDRRGDRRDHERRKTERRETDHH
jgi:hypothetical protein